MTDYWNDPPEVPELPECCEEIMETTSSGGLECKKCGLCIPPPEDWQEPPDMEIEQEDAPRNFECPHGRTGPCGKCDYLADIAYDAAREQKLCRR
jgi:hypothetical protein